MLVSHSEGLVYCLVIGMHTCMHTYIHTYIHTHIHTYIHTQLSTCVFLPVEWLDLEESHSTGISMAVQGPNAASAVYKLLPVKWPVKQKIE